MAAPGRNRWCPCGRRALNAARNRFALPEVAWEDPRTTAAMLGMAQRPEFDARRPPVDEDFDWLIAQLERRALADGANVWLRAGAQRRRAGLRLPNRPGAPRCSQAAARQAL